MLAWMTRVRPSSASGWLTACSSRRASAASVRWSPGGDDDETVAVEAQQEAARADRRLQPRAGHREQRVAGGAAERLVDRAEAVEVEHHQAGRAGGMALERRRDQPLGGGARPDRAVQRGRCFRRPRRPVGRLRQQRRRELGDVGERARQRRGQAPLAAIGHHEAAERAAVRPDDRRGRGEAGVEAERRRVDPARRSRGDPGYLPVARVGRAHREHRGGDGDGAGRVGTGVDQRGGVEARIAGQQPEERVREAFAATVPHLRAGPPHSCRASSIQPTVAWP